MPFDVITDHLITWMVLVPAITALALLATEGFGGLPRAAWRFMGLVSTTATLWLGVLLFSRFEPTRTGFQLVDYVPWIPEFGIHYYVGVDGISLPLVLLTAFLVPVALLASRRQIEHSHRSFVFFTLLLESSLLGALTSLNLFQFYGYWAGMLVPLCFIIGVWGGEARAHAAVKFAVMTALGSLLMLLAMLVVCHLGYLQTGIWTFDLAAPPWGHTPGLLEVEIATGGIWWQTQHWLFAGFALAFAIMVPLVPFHTWLPDAHVEAPTAGAVLLSGVLLKLGAYGFLRFALPLFPVAAVEWTPVILTLAAVGIVYASLLALVQSDIKRLVAYASIAHLGFVMLGIFALNLQGMNGGVLQMTSHGLFSGGLFLLVGMLEERLGTRQLEELGGIARPMPIYAFFFVLIGFASIGLPVLAGFVGEFLILLGAFRASPWHAVAATLGVLLSTLYMILLVRRLLFGPVANAEIRKLIDLDWREKGMLVALCIPIVVIGVYPAPLLRRIEPSVSDLLQQVEIRQNIVVEGGSGAHPDFALPEVR